jgi:ATP-dependent Clp protease ATP-binding subunit ClpC
MQGVWSPSARSVVERAAALAAERKVTPSTLHLLAAVLETSTELARRLRTRGLRAQDVRAPSRAPREPEGVFEKVQARAARLAETTGQRETLATHLIAASLAEPQSALANMAASLGVDPVGLASEIFHESAAPSVVRVTPAATALRASAGGVVASTVTRAPGVLPTPSVASKVKLSPLDARMVSPARTLLAAASAAPTVTTPAPEAPPPIPAPTARATKTPRPHRTKDARATTTPAAHDVDGALDPKSHPVLAPRVLPRAWEGPPVEGRDAELDRLRDALGRREGRGALIVGTAGVGKTSIVRAYASAATMNVVLLRHAELVAQMRGPHGETVRGLCDELTRAADRVVVALDPVAPWFTGRDVPEEVALELRALLSSGRIAWIGTATPEEARRLTETEGWIDRATVRVELDELPTARVRAIVEAHGRRLGEHHRVEVNETVTSRAVDLTDRYLGGRAQPDRTLAALDLALARARRQGMKSLDANTVATVVAELAGMPAARVASTDAERLLALESHLAARVVGHRAALTRVAHVIRRNAVGFRGTRPMGTFLLLGPTGVGKTETARAVAEALYPGVGAMARFDMAEYAEAHSVARLVGAPPGYVGYSEGGQLTEAVRRRAYQLVLLDEIEKAHRDVLEALLGLLDEARLTDGRGRTVDFRHTVVVMTSNLGAELYRERATSRSIGFGADRGTSGETTAQAVLSAARGALPPELWNRIDETLVYGPLGRDEIAEVARRLLAESSARLMADQGVEVLVTEPVIDLLLEGGGYEPSLGARPMRRAIARHVEAPLAEAVLRGELRRGDRAVLVAREGRVALERASGSLIAGGVASHSAAAHGPRHS